jgi:hypothetical protein
LVTVIGWVGVARAEEKRPESFDAAAQNAQSVYEPGALATLLQPLVAECPKGDGNDDLAQRQCAALREWALTELRAGTYIGAGDDLAVAIAPFDPVEKKLELEVRGCLACVRPLKIDTGGGGEPALRFVTTRVPKAIQAKSGKVVGLDVAFHEVSQPDERSAEAWRKKMASRLRVQFVFRIGAPWKSGSGDKVYEGVAFVPIAHRIVDKCSGKVIASDPPSSVGNGEDPAAREALRDASCPDEPTETELRAREEAALPLQLAKKDVNAVVSTIRERLHACATEFEETGTVPTKIVVAPSGKVESVTLQPPWDKRPVGFCVRSTVKSLTFPRFRGDKMIFDYALRLE